MGKAEPPRIAVLGAGPIGLEAALYARKLGLAVTVYEQGRVGEHLHRWGHVRLFTSYGSSSTSLGRSEIRADNARHEFPPDSACVTGRDLVGTYLEPLARCAALKGCVRPETRVLHVGRKGLLKGDAAGERRAEQPFRLIIREGKNRERADEADIVIDCTGTYGRHRWLGDGGIPAVGEEAAEPHIAYALEDVAGARRTHYAGKSVLVVGGGYSAATTVCSLSELAEAHPETWVVWLTRGSGSQPLHRVANDPLRDRDRLAARANALATRGDGAVEFHNRACVESVESAGPDRGYKITARVAGKPRTWDVDRLIANVGYSPDASLYRELQVSECLATLAPVAPGGRQPPPASPTSSTGLVRNPEPNFFVLGAKSLGRNSQFLLSTGFEQIREVFAWITGRPGLNLYRSGS